MLMRLNIPWDVKKRWIRNSLIAKDSMLLAQGKDLNKYTSTVRMLVIPYDRYRDVWLDPIELPVDETEMKLVDFVGPLSFRLILLESATRPWVSNWRLYMLTCTISDDLRNISVENKELLTIINNPLIFRSTEVRNTSRLLFESMCSQVDVYDFEEQTVDKTAQFGAHRNAHDDSFYFVNRNIYIEELSNSLTLFALDLDTKKEQHHVVRLASRGTVHHLSTNGKLIVYEEVNRRVTVYNVAAHCNQPPSHSIKLNGAGVLRNVIATPCGNAIVTFFGEEEDSHFWLWTNPPKLGEVALAVIHQHMPKQTKAKLRAVNVPLLGYSHFVETLISYAK